MGTCTIAGVSYRIYYVSGTCISHNLRMVLALRVENPNHFIDVITNLLLGGHRHMGHKRLWLISIHALLFSLTVTNHLEDGENNVLAGRQRSFNMINKSGMLDTLL